LQKIIKDKGEVAYEDITFTPKLLNTGQLVQKVQCWGHAHTERDGMLILQAQFFL
jgi:hypothetical protein